MIKDNTKKDTSIFSGLFWTFMERIGAQGVSFVLSLVLARILLPEDYGAIAIVQIFITFANVIATTGLSAAIIQKKNLTKEEDASGFVLNMIFSIVTYIIIFLTAPFIAKIYNLPIISSILRVLGLRIPICAFNSMQRAYVSRNLLFKKFFYSTLGGTVVSAFVGIILALLGFGAWALVFQYLTNNIIDTIILLITVDWRPSLKCTLSSMKSLLSFGWKVLAGALLSEVYLELRSFVIGLKYSATDLAYYKRGQQFPALFLTNITSALGSVMFPSLAKQQDNKDKIKEQVRKSIISCMFLMLPLMFGMAAVAKPLVEIILTSKWSKCIPYLIIYCLSYSILPIQTLSEQAYKGMGLGGVLLKTQILSKIIGIIFILITLPFGVFYIAVGMLISTIISVVVYMFPNKKYLKYTFKEQINDILPIFICASLMVVIIKFIELFIKNMAVSFLLQIIFGILSYLIFSIVFKVPALVYYKSLLKKYIVRGRK